ncbi:hypothetical protein EYF80_049321 [Liparis tanakae]|uniref:Uncharacterized protein n=1 Tax=Liparis tanakae TaxID=230148 RepID=A0A4Z2FJQ4_9TELE|nr:hypothetical protein EYF80_049321 [Liparis tanakae]
MLFVCSLPTTVYSRGSGSHFKRTRLPPRATEEVSAEFYILLSACGGEQDVDFKDLEHLTIC